MYPHLEGPKYRHQGFCGKVLLSVLSPPNDMHIFTLQNDHVQHYPVIMTYFINITFQELAVLLFSGEWSPFYEQYTFCFCPL
jgi:hypothetical protein